MPGRFSSRRRLGVEGGMLAMLSASCPCKHADMDLMLTQAVVRRAEHCCNRRYLAEGAAPKSNALGLVEMPPAAGPVKVPLVMVY